MPAHDRPRSLAREARPTLRQFGVAPQEKQQADKAKTGTAPTSVSDSAQQNAWQSTAVNQPVETCRSKALDDELDEGSSLRG